MRVYENTSDGGRRAASSKRVKFSTDNEGKLVEVYEEISEYSEIVAENVVDWYQELAARAKERVRNNQSSALEYFMCRAEMEPETLAAVTGFSVRQVKKHFRPHAVEAMDLETLRIYAEALQAEPEEILHFKRSLT